VVAVSLPNYVDADRVVDRASDISIDIP
jgi:uncharacterized lipoprotein YmbA